MRARDVPLSLAHTHRPIASARQGCNFIGVVGRRPASAAIALMTDHTSGLFVFSCHTPFGADDGLFATQHVLTQDVRHLVIRSKSIATVTKHVRSDTSGPQHVPVENRPTSTSTWPTGKAPPPPFMFMRASRMLMYDTSGSMPTFVDDPLNHNLRALP